MKSAPSVLVVGSSNTDLAIQMERLPKPGETILGGRFTTAAGGKGANQAVAAARAGAAVTFIARIGQDIFGDQAVAALLSAGVHIDHVLREPNHPSGVALIFIGSLGENSIAVAPGSNAYLTPSDLQKAQKKFSEADMLVLQLESPRATVQAAVALASTAGLRVVLNPAPAQPLPKKLLRQVFVLTPNETEATLLTGVAVRNQTSAAEAASILHSQGVQNVIITMGSGGAYISAQGVGQLIPGYKVKVVDTTAAGDVFSGALAVALAEGRTLVEAACFANAAAAISVTRLGAQPSAPSREEIERRRAAG